MSAYCYERQRIYMLWVTEPDPEAKVEQYAKLTAHHKGCATCRKHMAEMTTFASKAKHPEYQED